MEGVTAATAHLLREGPALQDRVSRLADRLADRLNLWFQDNRVPLRLMHFGPQFLFEGFGPYSALAQPIELPLFYLLLMERGIYTWERRTCGLCTEHTEEDVRSIEEAVRDSVQALRDAGFSFSLDKGAPSFFTPMSPTEERLYAIFQREHGQDAYHLPLAWKIEEKDGRLDTELLEICLGQCIRRHEALRSSFHHIEGQLVRKVVDEPPFALEFVDATGDNAPSAEELLRNFVRPFDLTRAPLLRAGLATMADGSRLFMLDLLHIAADGASLGILLDDLNALMNGREPALKPGSLREAQASADRLKASADTQYWTERLRELPPLELPLDFPARSGSPLGRQEWMVLDADLTASARRACRKYSVTLNMFLGGVYALLLHKLCGGTRFCVGMAEGGRHDEAMAGVMGMFVNTVPQDFTVRPEWTMPEFMAEVRAACVDSMEHNRAPYGDLVNAMGWSPAATMLSYEKADERRPAWPGLEFTAMVPPGHGAMYDFALDIVEMDGVLHCNILSSEALRPETARCFGQCFAHLVAEAAFAADSPTTTVHGLSALPAAQAEKILHAWRGASVPYPSRTVVDLFRHSAASHPHANALVFRDQRLTYAELDGKSDALARHLAAIGVGRENVVAILLDRGADFVIAALGAMKAGAAYLPLDPAAPASRLSFQLGDASPLALISLPAHRPPREHFSGTWIDAANLPDLPGTAHLPNPSAPGPHDLAYIIYTSGTTGQPKGVMIEQRSLSSLCHWFTRHYAITSEDRTTAFAPFIFDASVWEIFPMLMQGATVHILDDDTRHDLPRLHEYLRREKITVAYFLSQVAEMIDGTTLPDLRLLLSGGEVLRLPEAAGSYRHCNTYGPTEFTVTATSFDLDGTWPVPIGAPVDNAWALILDADGRPQPIGVPGELCLAGNQLARGYLNRPELTAAAFVPNPLAEADPAYGRMYRTGDLCRWLPDGNIEYLGRLDGQIKIRGHRVEPGEIEKTLLACAGVGQCAVMVRDDAGAQLLCAYVVLEDSAEAGSIRAFAANHLPAYMIPDRVIAVESIPVNASGKVDKAALPAPTMESGRPFDAPRTAEERLLAEIWAEQLNVEKIGRDDHFFELGGDSIKALMVTSRVRARGYQMETRDFFRDATIAALAPRLVALRQAETPPDTSDPVPDEDRIRIRALFGDAATHVHDLAPLQHGIVFHGQLHPDSPAYIEQTLLAVHGPLDAAGLGRRLDALMARHGMLRTAIVSRGVSKPWQVVLDQTWFGEKPLQEEDLRGLDKDSRQRRVRACMDAERARGFDLTRPPLMRFCLLRTGETDHVLLCTAHHVIVDGWSMGVLFSELFSAQDFGPRPAQFHDYVAWLKSQDRERPWPGGRGIWTGPNRRKCPDTVPPWENTGGNACR
jgi:amino acid adenylation domain-containing protein